MPDRGWRPFHRSRLRYDAAFRAEVEYCVEKGLPHSHLLGGPLEWDTDDREKMIAFMLERSERCSLCGTSGWEWEEDWFGYEPVVTTCHGCELKDMGREDAQGPGSSIVLVPKAEAARLRAMPKKAPRRRNSG